MAEKRSTNVVGFRLTPEEEALVDTLRAPLGCNRSTLIRSLLKAATVQASIAVEPLVIESDASD